MKPKPRPKTDYEKVSIEDFIPGVIDDIRYEEFHEWKDFKDKKTGKVTVRTPSEAVQFVFRLEGYEFPKKTRWMSFSYGGKSTMFSKYLMSLVENAEPDMDFDIDLLKGMKIKTLWSEKGDFQSVETIRPIGKKLVYSKASISDVDPAPEVHESEPEEEVPF